MVETGIDMCFYEVERFNSLSEMLLPLNFEKKKGREW